MSMDVEEQYDKIYKYCYFKVQNSYLAQDLTQETFLKYFSQNSYIDRGKPLAYLYTIAKNLCVDAFREKQQEELDEDYPTDDEMGHVELKIVMKEAVKTLPEIEQEILLLRYANELSIGEICKITECSRFVVYRKIKTALSQLKTILKNGDYYG